MDRYNENDADIREIKPNNPRGRRACKEQLKEYKKEMDAAKRRSHTTELALHDKRVGGVAWLLATLKKQTLHFNLCEGFCFLFREGHGLKLVASLAPAIQAALQRPDMFHALSSEEQRHTGAGSFIRSSTVEDYFTIRRQPFVLYLQLLYVHAKRARDRFRVGFKIK